MYWKRREQKKRTRGILIGLLCILIGLSVPGVVFAADDGNVYTFSLSSGGADTIALEVGDTFDVTLDLVCSGTQDSFRIYAASFVLKYNPDYFEPSADSVVFEKQGMETFISNTYDDLSWKGWKDLSVDIITSGMSGSFRTSPSRLMTMTFTAKKTGISTIRCDSTGMSDVSGASLSSKGGKLTVVVSGNGRTDDPDPVTFPFTDVPEGTWYRSSVEYVYEHGVMNGVSETEFAPMTELSRAMMVQILYNLEGRPDAVGGSDFTDVRSDQWFAKAVQWASANGIVSGYPDGAFLPQTSITREQTAVILFRYASWKKQDTSARADLNRFTDASAVSAYAKDAVAWANGCGIINGMSETELVPAGTANRAQIAKMMRSYLEKDAEQK